MKHAIRDTIGNSAGRFVLPRSVLLFFLSILMISAALPLFGSECSPPPDLENPWNLGPHDLDALSQDVGSPELVEKLVRPLSNNESGALEVRAHMHALFKEDFAAFEDAIRDLARQQEFLPRLETSKPLCRSGRPLSYARVRQKLAFRLLIFSRTYEYVLHYNFDESSRGNSALDVWWVLAEPLDDQIIETDGSWYFEEVEVNGERYTYMAYATHTVFRERKLGLQAALERFGERDVRNAMLAMREEAARLSR